jgi:hypothetical protein
LGEAGTVVVMNTHAWHGGTANRTGRRRAPCVLHPRGQAAAAVPKWPAAGGDEGAVVSRVAPHSGA